MKSFQFRAEAALDLRRRQEEAARRALGVAEQAARDAERALAEAERALAEGLARAGDEAAGEENLVRAVWYRNWMSGQKQAIARRRQDAAVRRAEAERAAAAAQQAHRLVRSLERLRDRAFGEYQRAVLREEQKALDELAGLRFVRDRAESGGYEA